MNLSLLYRKPLALYCIIGLLVMLLLIVPLTNTRVLFSKYTSLKRSLSKMKNSKDVGEEEQFSLFDTLQDVSDAYIFKSVSVIAHQNHILIKKYEPSQILSNDDEVQYKTQQIVLEGEFVAILKCMQEVDSRLAGVKIASVKFDREESNKKVTLAARIIFQTVKISQENEE